MVQCTCDSTGLAPHFNLWHVVTGCNSTSDPATATDQITIRDNGDMTARWAANTGGVISSGSLRLTSPNAPVYKKTCTFLHGSIYVILRRGTTADYSAPPIDQWLTKLGLAQVQVISQSLIVHVDHTPFPVESPLAPAFFASLEQVGVLVIQECQSCVAGDRNVPPRGPSALLSLPGLFGLTRFWNFESASMQPSSLIVTGTALPNFQGTLPNLRCSPQTIQISNNRVLTRLDGINALTTNLRPGPTVEITGNALASPASVAALLGLAACPQSPLTSSVLIQTTTCSATVSSLMSIVIGVMLLLRLVFIQRRGGASYSTKGQGTGQG